MVTMLRRIVAVVVCMSALVACVPGSQKPEDTRLRMGLLPVLDTLPFYVADQKGYYQAEGITVELVPVKGAQERDALLQAGEIDGMLTDLVAVGLFNREKPQVKVVATALRASPQAAMFRILAAPGSGLKSAGDLAGVPIAVSQNTIIQYITDRLLAAEGMAPGQIQVIEVSAIPVRFEQLMAGQVKAATLPDPLASGALAGGAQLIVDDTKHTQYSQTVLAFSQAAVDAKPNTIKKLLSAWNKAVQDLNSQPDQFADLLIEKGRVPESIRGSYRMPGFPQGEVPTQSEWRDVVGWMLEKKLIDHEIAYDSAVLTSLVNR
jgi:NitT/TauT family transport system substrate-binding protein